MTSLDKTEDVVEENPVVRWAWQKEDLRRTTLMKQRRISEQLKQGQVQRQLQRRLRSEAHHLQLRELSGELRELSRSLDGGLSTPKETPQKAKISHQSSAPTRKGERKHWLGELRAVASLSSLAIKPTKEAKPWRTPFRFLGHLMDQAGLRRKLWGASDTSRARSEDDMLRDRAEVTSSAESSDEEDDWNSPRTTPLERKGSGHEQAKIDPVIMAEIEDFEKMAAQYIHEHS